MANTGYGQEKYGRSLYGALTYHDLEASVSANASISVAPSLNFSIPSQPINAIGSITSILIIYLQIKTLVLILQLQLQLLAKK